MRLLASVKSALFTGTLLVAPVVGAAYVVYWLVTSVDGLFPASLRPSVGGVPLPGLGLLAVALLALVVGFLAHNFVGRRLAGFFDAILPHIPIFGGTYSLLKQVLEAVFSSSGSSFSRAVL